MNFKEYEEQAITTKCYADEVAIPYVVLGLCGELGEFIEKLINHEKDKSLIFKELGDICWYVAAIRIEMNLDPIEWPDAVVESNTNPIVYVGKIAEQTKKWLRDDWKGVGTEVPEKRKKEIHDSLDMLLHILHTWLIDANAGVTLQDIAKQNIEKLADRARRDKIKGSGDER